MTATNENSRHPNNCGCHADTHPKGDARVVDSEPVPVTGQTVEGRDLGLKDVHAAGGTCDCAPGECTCGHHQTCDCAPGECKCGEKHGHAQGGVPDHGDCECEQCKNADSARHEGAQECGCGCGHGADNAAKDFTNPDTVNADGTNPAVRTVDKAEGYNENAGWNDDQEPKDCGCAEGSGAGDRGEDHVN